MVYSDPDCSHCFCAIKRWDSIALHEFCELHPEFLNRFNCEISGGAGGVNGLTPTSNSSIPVASVSKASKASSKRAELADISQKKFFDDLVNAIKPVAADPQANLTEELLQVSATLRELAASQDSDDDELIVHYRKRKVELRYATHTRMQYKPVL